MPDFHFCVSVLLTLSVVDCGALDDPSGGVVDPHGTTYRSVATYSCNEGYVMTGGDSVRVCEFNGIWLGSEPTCERKQTVKMIFLEREVANSYIWKQRTGRVSEVRGRRWL